MGTSEPQHKRRVSLVCPTMSVKNRLLGSRQPAAEVSGATGWINTPLERVPAEGRGLRAQGRDQITRLGHCWALSLPPIDFVGVETVGTNLTAARCGGCSRLLRLPRLSPTRVPGFGFFCQASFSFLSPPFSGQKRSSASRCASPSCRTSHFWNRPCWCSETGDSRPLPPPRNGAWGK